LADPRFHIGQLFAELSRRKVIRVAVTYGIVGFAVIQAANIIVDAINLPAQFVVYIIVAIFLGLPVAIVLAWSYDIVPDAEVRRVQSEDPAEYHIDTPARSGFPLVRSLIAFAILTIIAVTWYEFDAKVPETPARRIVTYIDSVAVLPFENMTGDPSYDHVGIGITEEIITQLARIAPLKVISRHSVQAAAAQNLTIPQVANALGVRHVIEGSIRIDGQRLRVALQHINAETDAHMWAENLNAPVGDIIRLQEDIARFAVAKFVDVIPGLTLPTISNYIDLGPGQQAHLEGRRWMGQRTSEGLNNAVHYFTESLQLDPGYAPAYADLASAYALALSYRYDIGVDGYTIAANALTLSEKAIELDPNMATGYAARGLLGILIGDSAAAIAADFDRAEQLAPNAASIPSWRSLVQAQLGNTDEALAEAARAVNLDPLAPSRQIAVANVAFELGRFDEAIGAARIATALEPRLVRGRAIEARSHVLSDRPDLCANLILGAYRVLRATCLEASGRTIEAKSIIDNVLSEIAAGHTSEPGYTEVITFEELATYYASTGNAAKAQEWLVRSFATSPSGIEFRVLDSKFFDPVRSNHNFAAAITAIRSDLHDRVRRLSNTQK